jgi:hypothetical protein
MQVQWVEVLTEEYYNHMIKKTGVINSYTCLFPLTNRLPFTKNR